MSPEAQRKEVQRERRNRYAQRVRAKHWAADAAWKNEERVL
jgi:hypothetical protein